MAKGIAVDQQQVGEEAFAHLAERRAHAHDLAAARSRADDRLHRRETQQVDEVGEVARIRPVRIPHEAVVAPRRTRTPRAFSAFIVAIVRSRSASIRRAASCRSTGRPEVAGVAQPRDGHGQRAARRTAIAVRRFEQVERLVRRRRSRDRSTAIRRGARTS